MQHQVEGRLDSQLPSVGFIGAGNMALALASGLVRSGVSTTALRAADPFAASRERFAAALPGAVVGTDNHAVAAEVDALVVAVKPQQLDLAVAGLATAFQKRRPLVLSIVAGVETAALAARLGTEVPLVRCMPNTPALVGQGITGLYADDSVTATERQLAERVMGAAGGTFWVADEDALHAVTAISGCGPAYFFRIIEALETAAQERGLEPALARRLATQTALGAARLAADSDEAVGELRRRVASPGGATEAALTVLEGDSTNEGVETLLRRTVAAAESRSRQLAAAAKS